MSCAGATRARTTVEVGGERVEVDAQRGPLMRTYSRTLRRPTAVTSSPARHARSPPTHSANDGLAERRVAEEDDLVAALQRRPIPMSTTHTSIATRPTIGCRSPAISDGRGVAEGPHDALRVAAGDERDRGVARRAVGVAVRDALAGIAGASGSSTEPAESISAGREARR